MKIIQHFVGGRSFPGNSNKKGKIFNPATGEQTAEVKLATKKDVNEAIISAKKAFVENNQVRAELSNLKFKLSINYDDFSNSKIYGNLDSLSADQLAAFLNITFFIEGLNSPKRNLII